MKRMLLLVFALMLISWGQAPFAMADSISSGDYVKLIAYNSLDAGGVMTLEVSHDASSNHTVAFNYGTFCIQDNVYITPGTWYPVAAVSNTVGYFDTTVAGGGPLNGAVDYLFYQYKSGAYTSFDANSQNDFQRLLWSLQGSGAPYTSTGTPWASGLASYNNPSNGLQHPWGTMVINIVSGEDSNNRFVGPDIQNLLYNPVPEPATMLLLCSGLLGLVGLGRKFKN